MSAPDLPREPSPGLPLEPAARRWRVTLADGSAKVVEAAAFRVEGGALVLARPAGSLAAFAPGTWASVEAAP